MNNLQSVNKYNPDYIVTPGEVLEDHLEHVGLTQASLADRTGLSKKTINEIIKAKSAITAETALKFERTLNRPAHFWSNLERQYQEDKTRLADKKRLEEYLYWLKIFPVNAMATLGWIEKSRIKTQQLDALLRFFAVASPTQWETIWIRELQTAFRGKEKSQKDIAVISAWLRKGEIVVQQQRCVKYDKQKFLNSLTEIRSLTTTEPNIFVPRLESICAACGVAIVFVPALPKLGIYGATRRLNDKYIMQLSLYSKTNDQLWFTIFHEACHIIKHPQRELYIEGKGLENEKTKEDEADVFAQNLLIPPDQLKHFLASEHKPTLQQIKQFAKSINIAPGIVVGRLQHDRILSWEHGNDLKVRYVWAKE
ncbi:MAG: HigA family addiction module antitoxin [Leptospirales bacterium]|nr:HigA family addiction module antitoxin [Leptospirales bacterium]